MSVIDAVRTAHDALRAAVPGLRRTARSTEGRLAAAYREAMRIMDAQKADGVPFLERLKGLDGVIRQFWPFTREWQYLCLGCRDCGLVIAECSGDTACGRHIPHQPHSFGTPCWCDKGKPFRPKAKPSPEDFQSAGKSKPMSRMGR